MPIRVCHLTSVHPLEDIRIFSKECKSLAYNGFNVALIVCGNTSFEDIKDGVVRISLVAPIRNRLQRIIKRTNAVYKRALLVNADIYHLHDPELLVIALRLKRKGKKVIFDSHEFYGEQIKTKQYLPAVLRNIIAYIYMKYEAYICRKIDAVIQVCTLQGKDYFRNRAANSIKIRNVPLLRNHNLNKILSFESRKSIVYIGSLAYERGITHLIKSSANAKCKLILCGNFISEEYQKRINSLPEYSVVDYRGYLCQNEIDEVFNECIAGVSTLLHVGQYPKIDILPSKVYEYMYAGLPVIISNTQFAKKMVEKYKFGICVDPCNIDEISNAILYLFNNPLIAKRMGSNGRDVVLRKFNWNVEENKLLKLYNNLSVPDNVTRRKQLIYK